MEDTASIELALSYSKILNYAMHQNHVPVIRELIVHNTTDQDMRDLTITIEDSMGLAEAWNKRLDLVPAQSAVAIYHAIQQEKIIYSVLPPSFEESGQRIRLPDTLFSYRMGNCLDITVLLAACLEAVGLHPLIIFKQGHAFVGAWIVDETFPESVQDDVSLLTKRTADGLREICLVETTLLTSSHPVSFEEAERVGRANLDDEGKFILFVDVKRTRFAAIRPLPLRIKTEAGWRYEHPSSESTTMATQAPSPIENIDIQTREVTSALPKLKEWERRLLDLSLRNSLLNFRATRASVPLLPHELHGLEDALANDIEFQLLAAPSDWVASPRDSELFRYMENGSLLDGVLDSELKQKRLRADLTEADLRARSTSLYRASRASLEENGANTLYLALGLSQVVRDGHKRKNEICPPGLSAD